MAAANRPVTSQGMKGMRPTTASQRAYQDKNFFIPELHSRMALLTGEMGRLQAELDRFNVESEQYGQFEKKADALGKELREMQGQLADYNMLVDKMHTDTDLGDIVRQTQRLHEKNVTDARRVDALFTERTAKEDLRRGVEEEIENVRRDIEQDLSRLAPEKLQQFRNAERENEQLKDAIEHYQRELDLVSNRVASMEASLRSDPVRSRAFAVHSTMRELAARRKDMLDDAADMQAAGPDEKNRLLARVKADATETAAMSRRIEQLQEDVYRVRDQLAELDSEAGAQQGDKYEKYMAILEKEKQIQAFIDEFPAVREQLAGALRERETAIAGLLHRISAAMARQGDLPEAGTVRDMEARLDFQEEQMSAAESTQVKLLREREQRQVDLKKLAQLDKKIERDIESIRTRIPQMEAELVTFSNTDKLKADAKKLEQRLTAERARLRQQRQMMRVRVARLADAVKTRSEALEASDTHLALAAHEAKLAIYMQTNAELREYIDTKTFETDYHARLATLGPALAQLNTLVSENVRFLPKA